MATNLKEFNATNVTSTKQFSKAANEVFAGITGRNKQLQQLLILAVNEAAKLDAEGNTCNNLSWLAALLQKADETKGFNGKKIGQYVKEVLTCSTTKYTSAKDGKPAILSKKDKDTKLAFECNPESTWYDYGKQATVSQGFDYGKRLKSTVAACLDDEKGKMKQEAVLLAVLDAGVEVDTLLKVMETLAIKAA